MSDSSVSMVTQHDGHLRGIEKLILLSSWIVACALILSVGPFALGPDFPRQPVSLIARDSAFVSFVGAAALALIAGGTATIIAGRVLPDVGTFAASLGLALASTRGGTTSYLLLDYAEQNGSTRSLLMTLSVEALAWFSAIFMVMLLSHVLLFWVYGSSAGRRDETDASGRFPLISAGETLFSFRRRLTNQTNPGTASHSVGTYSPGTYPPQAHSSCLFFTILAAVVGLIALTIFSAALRGQGVHHGQSLFTAGASCAIGVYFAQKFFPVRSIFWAVLPVPLVALGAYWGAMIAPEGTGGPSPIPRQGFLRILPVQYIGMGSAAAIAMFWHVGFPGPEVYTPIDKPTPQSLKR